MNFGCEPSEKGLNSRTGLEWGLTGVILIWGGATSEIQQALLHASVGAPDTRPATPKEESRPSGTRDDRSDICPDNDDDADVGPDSPEDIRSDC